MADFDPDKFMTAQAPFDPDQFMTGPKGPQPMPTLKPGLHAGVTASGAPVGFGDFRPAPPVPQFVNPLTGNPTQNQTQNPNFSDSSTVGKVSNDLFDAMPPTPGLGGRATDPKTGKPLTAAQRVHSLTQAGKDVVTSPAMIPALGIMAGGAPLLPQVAKAVSAGIGAGVTGLGAKEAIKLSGGDAADQELGQAAAEIPGGVVGERALPEAAANLKGWGTQLLNHVQALGTVLPKFSPTNRTMTAADQAMKIIRDESVQGPNLPNHPGTPEPITHIGVLKDMADSAVGTIQNAYNQWLDRADQAGIQMNPWPTIRDAYLNAMSKTEKLKNPQVIQETLAQLQNAFDHNMSVHDIDAIRSEGGLASFYDKNTGAQYSDLAHGKDMAIDSKVRDAITRDLYTTLDPEGNGLRPRTIKQIQGQAIQIRDAAEDHEAKAFLEPALTRLQGAAMGVRNTYRQLSPWSHPNAAEASPFKGKTNALIEKAFGELEGAPEPLPLPQGPHPYSRQLPAATPPGPYSQAAAGFAGVDSPFNPVNAMAGRMLPASPLQSNQGGVIVPDIIGRSNRGPGAQGLLPAPVPGMPPINILPSGMPAVPGASRRAVLQRVQAGGFPATGASGPAGSVPVLGSEQGLAMPGEVGGRIQDIQAPHLNFSAGRDQTNPLIMNIPNDPITVRTEDGRYYTVSKSALENSMKNDQHMTKSQIDERLDFMTSGGRVPLGFPEPEGKK